MAEQRIFEKCRAGTQPEYLHPEYRSSVKRAPTRPLILLPHTLSERTGPVFGQSSICTNDHDLTAQHEKPPLGERIVVTGQLLDGELIERQVFVEGVDDPIAPLPKAALGIDMVPVRVRVARGIQPIMRHLFAVIRRT